MESDHNIQNSRMPVTSNERRIAAWLQLIRDEIAATNPAFAAGEFTQPDNPTLSIVYARATRIARETVDEFKLAVLRRFVVSVASMTARAGGESGEPSESIEPWKLDFILTQIERLTSRHLQALQFLNDPRSYLTIVGRGKLLTGDGLMPCVIATWIERVAPEIMKGLPEGYFAVVESDLRSAGLIAAGSFEQFSGDERLPAMDFNPSVSGGSVGAFYFHQSTSGDGLAGSRTTELGKLLVRLAIPEVIPPPPAPAPKPVDYAAMERKRRQEESAKSVREENEKKERERLARQQEQDEKDAELARDEAKRKEIAAKCDRQHPTYRMEEADQVGSEVESVAVIEAGPESTG